MDHLSEIEREEAERVNEAEELLLRARRVARLVEERVQEVLNLDGAPTLHAPGVESNGP